MDLLFFIYLCLFYPLFSEQMQIQKMFTALIDKTNIHSA